MCKKSYVWDVGSKNSYIWDLALSSPWGKSFNSGKTFILNKSVTISFTRDNVEIMNIFILTVVSSWFPYIYIYGFTQHVLPFLSHVLYSPRPPAAAPWLMIWWDSCWLLYIVGSFDHVISLGHQSSPALWTRRHMERENGILLFGRRASTRTNYTYVTSIIPTPPRTCPLTYQSKTG